MTAYHGKRVRERDGGDRPAGVELAALPFGEHEPARILAQHMHVLPPLGGKPLLSHFKKRLTQVNEVDRVPVRVRQILVHVLNVPPRAAANVHPDTLLLLLRRRDGLRLEVTGEELEHRLAPLEEVGARAVVDVGLALVERVEARLLPALGGGEEGLDEAVPCEDEGGAEGGREAEEDERPGERREGPSEDGGCHVEVRREERLDRADVSAELPGGLVVLLGRVVWRGGGGGGVCRGTSRKVTHDRPVRSTSPLARSAPWAGLIMLRWSGDG